MVRYEVFIRNQDSRPVRLTIGVTETWGNPGLRGMSETLGLAPRDGKVVRIAMMASGQNAPRPPLTPDAVARVIRVTCADNY